jgi:cytochrome c-type biogenesis protein
MSPLVFAYMIVAFVAGIIALMMPCCFSVLLPSYFAQSFKKKTRLVGMTALFSLGIATIMLPLALGIVALAQTVTANHSLVFVAGGFLMIILGFWSLWGRGMLPHIDWPVNFNRHDAVSVYTLGVFSGAATSCCAPVLAGVLVLSALSTTWLEAFLVGFTYVVGMVFPLFFLALIWDKYAMSGENPLRGRMVNLRYFGREFSIHSSKLVAGLIFIVMGGITVILGLTGTMIPTPGSAYIGLMQTQLERMIVQLFTSGTAMEPVLLAAVAVLIAAGLLLLSRRLNRAK